MNDLLDLDSAKNEALENEKSILNNRHLLAVGEDISLRVSKLAILQKSASGTNKESLVDLIYSEGSTALEKWKNSGDIEILKSDLLANKKLTKSLNMKIKANGFSVLDYIISSLK